MQILPRTIIVSLVVGTVVTFVSALAPARRAARVPPIAALRDQAVPPSSGRRRYIWGTVFTIIGAAALGLGLTSSGEQRPDHGRHRRRAGVHRRGDVEPADRAVRGTGPHLASRAPQEHHWVARAAQRDAQPAGRLPPLLRS